ncbi:MAG TPA: tetratricopeptide repeat protein [Anaeromyxobacteraceae bacterium]|nr:tetratricopeptide repeat protein [Anaeromyxobacteraceae bacterium]
MTGRALRLAALVALAPALAAPAPQAEDAPQRYRQVAVAMRHLVDEEMDQARALVEPLLEAHPGDPAVAMAAGVLRLHEQRYDEAVRLLEASDASSPGTPGDWLELARKAREVTRGYQRAEGRHVVVFHPKGKDEVLVPYLQEMLEAERAALERAFGRVPAGKVAVEIVPSTRDLARLSTLSEEEIKTSGTIAICKFNKLMVTSPKALLRGYDWLDTAAHEYVHYVVTRHTRNQTPIWLHEGIAKWAETLWRGRGGESMSPYSAALLRDAARQGRLITFAQMHPSMAKLPSQEDAALAFAEVLAAVEWIERRGGPGALVKVLDNVAEGRPADQAVSRALSLPFDAFLAEWRRWMATRPLPEGGDRELKVLRFKGDPKHGGSHSEWADIPDDRARGFARLGEIFRERGRWEAARQEYAKAVSRVGGRSAALASKFALASLMSGREGEAAAVLGEAVRLHPGYAALHVNMGRLYAKKQSWQAARDAFLLANRTDPFDPEIHAGLARAYEALGEKALAEREQRFAGLLAGGDER